MNTSYRQLNMNHARSVISTNRRTSIFTAKSMRRLHRWLLWSADQRLSSFFVMLIHLYTTLHGFLFENVSSLRPFRIIEPILSDGEIQRRGWERRCHRRKTLTLLSTSVLHFFLIESPSSRQRNGDFTGEISASYCTSHACVLESKSICFLTCITYTTHGCCKSRYCFPFSETIRDILTTSHQHCA